MYRMELKEGDYYALGGHIHVGSPFLMYRMELKARKPSHSQSLRYFPVPNVPYGVEREPSSGFGGPELCS